MYNRPVSASPTSEPLARAVALPRSAALSLALRRSWPYLVLFASGLLVAWLSLLPPRDYSIDVGTDGSHDVGFMQGIYTRERVETRTYRWLRGDATISLPSGRNGPVVFTIEMYSAPRVDGSGLPLTLRAGPAVASFVVAQSERTYHLLFPAASLRDGALGLGLDGPTYSPPGDDRLLSVAVDRIALRQTTPGGPVWRLALVQALLPALLLLALRANRVGLRAGLIVGLLAIGGLAWANLAYRLWASAAPFALAFAALPFAAAGLAAQRWLLPANSVAPIGIEKSLYPRTSARFGTSMATADGRFAWALWLVVIVGAAVRVAGVLTPGFEFRDLDIQSLQFSRVNLGQVYLTVGVHEWGGARTYYPSGPYVLLLPLLLLLPSQAMALHIGVALLDAAGAVLLAMLARELGASRRAALIAAWLLAWLPVQFTAIFWGFSTNIIGQALLLLALWLLLRYAKPPLHSQFSILNSAWLLGLSLVLVALSHIGVLLMAGPLLALLFVAALISLPRQRRAGLVGAFGGAGLFFALTYLSLIVAPMLGQAAGVYTSDNLLSSKLLAEGQSYIRSIIPVALWRGMVMLPTLAAPLGLLLLWGRRPDWLGRTLLLAWPLVPLAFLLIDYLTLSQVRYVYFAAPVCCLALAVLLDRLGRSRAGRVVLIAAVVLIAVTGAILWFNGAVLGYKPSLVPLTH